MIPPEVVNVVNTFTWAGDGTNILRLTWHTGSVDHVVNAIVHMQGFEMFGLNSAEPGDDTDATTNTRMDGWLNSVHPALTTSTDAAGAVHDMVADYNLAIRY